MKRGGNLGTQSAVASPRKEIAPGLFSATQELNTYGSDSQRLNTETVVRTVSPSPSEKIASKKLPTTSTDVA